MCRPPLRSGLVGCLLLLTALGARAPAAQPGTLDVSGTTVGAPTAALPLFGSTPGDCTLANDPEPYDPTPFTVTPDGSYAVDVVEPISTIPDTDDTVLLVYEGTFNPADACAHLVGIGNETARSGLTVALAAVSGYVLVVAGFFGTEDAFTVRITGPEGSTVSRGGEPPVDTTAPVCGPIVVERNGPGALSAIASSASDPESGVASVTFTTLRNLRGYVGEAGPYTQGDTHTTADPNPGEVSFRGERVSFSAGGALVVRVTNGAGLWRDCDPVVSQLSATAPEAFALEAPYPNPSRAGEPVRLGLAVAEGSEVRVSVYDLPAPAAA